MAQVLNQNLHLLLPKKELGVLKQLSRSNGVSVGELIRRAIRKVYQATDPDQRLMAFNRLAKRNELLMEDWEVVKKDLNHRYG